jgi:hypothetical protein
MAKIQYWVKLLLKFVSVQLVVQALGFSSGILIINNLSKTDYSYYLLANTMQFTMDLMADFGITIGLNSIGGKIWQDTPKFSQLIATAFAVRRYLLIASTLVVMPILFVMLFNNGASLPTIICLMIAVLIELQFYSTNKILGIVPRLNSNINLIQKLDFILAFARLVGLFIACALGVNVVTATLCSTLASGIYSFLLSKWVRDKIDLASKVNLEYKTEIVALTKSLFFPTMFYCLQGQITIWIITVFGKVSGIAEIGALSRLGLILTIVNPVVNSIIVPSYARCQSIELLKKRYWQFITGFLAFAGVMLLIASTFSTQILWILGSKYAHLNNELMLVMVGSLINNLTTMIWGLNYAKAWVDRSWLTIPTTIAMQALLLFALDLSTVRGAIIFGLFSAIPSLGVNLYMSFRGMKMSLKF